MAEEIEDASRVLPQALMISVGLNGCLGFGILIAMLFCASPDLGGKLGKVTGYPYMGIFLEATDSVSGSLAMSAIVIVIYVLAMMGLLAASSRQLWSFSRDRGVPGWRWLSRVRSYLITLEYEIERWLRFHINRFPHPGICQSTPSWSQ